MNEMLLALVLAYLFFTALLLLALIYSRLPVLLKIGLVVVAVGFYWLSYQGWKETQGWPALSTLPDKFLLHAAVVDEPDKDAGIDGVIQIWVSDLRDDQVAVQPRAYQMPYEIGMHGKIQEAERQMNNGNLQIGITNPRMRDSSKGSKKKRAGQKYPNLEFVRLPDPALPEK